MIGKDCVNNVKMKISNQTSNFSIIISFDVRAKIFSFLPKGKRKEAEKKYYDLNPNKRIKGFSTFIYKIKCYNVV